MNRFVLNCFFVLIAMVAGVGMFLLKYEVIKEEEILYALQRQIKEDRWEIHTLKADWAHLTDPPRLRVLVDTYTTLQKINARYYYVGYFDLFSYSLKFWLTLNKTLKNSKNLG